MCVLVYGYVDSENIWPQASKCLQASVENETPTPRNPRLHNGCRPLLPNEFLQHHDVIRDSDDWNSTPLPVVRVTMAISPQL